MQLKREEVAEVRLVKERLAKRLVNTKSTRKKWSFGSKMTPEKNREKGSEGVEYGKLLKQGSQ